jgi:hypothetical protein
MPNTEQETRAAIAEFTVTKVLGQPTTQDIDLLEDELTAIASSFPTSLGGGMHGHAGLLKSALDYDQLAPGTPFIAPLNPGIYPAGNIPAAQRGQREAEHKELIKEFEKCTGANKGLKDLILQAIDEDFLLELKVPGIAYLNVTPLQMMTHLRSRYGSMDYVDINALMAECDTPWDPTEVPTKHFNRVEKARRQLARANIQIDERAMLVKALKSFKDAGDFDAPIREWEARPVAMQTYENLKVVMCTEFVKLNRQDATTARATGHASANAVGEYAQATEELVAELTEKHAKQIEALSTAMLQLTAAIKSNSNVAPAASARTPAANTGKTPAQLSKAQKWAEKCKNATTCPHCSKIHPNRTHDQCWHLEKNAAKRPAGWTASGAKNPST